MRIEEIRDWGARIADWATRYLGSVRDRPVRIAVTMRIRGDRAEVDFSRSDPQVQGSVNSVYAITASAVFYVFRTLVEAPIPSNAGGMRPIRIIAPDGTIVNARPPAAVCGGS